MTSELHEVAYRYDAMRISLGVDEHDRSYGYKVKLFLNKFTILRRTDKGFWIAGLRGPRFILNEGRKRYAVTSLKEALDSFYARKKAHLRFLHAELEYVQRQIEELKQLKLEEPTE